MGITILIPPFLFLTVLNLLAMADLFDSDEEELTIENDAVLTKYKTAGEISNLVSNSINMTRQPSLIRLSKFHYFSQSIY